MNISGLSSIIPKASNDIIGIMVMKKAMDTVQQEGQNMSQMLATMPHLGRTVDIKA